MSDKNTKQSSSSTGEGEKRTADFGIGGTASDLQITLSSGEMARRKRQRIKNKLGEGDNVEKGNYIETGECATYQVVFPQPTDPSFY